MVMEADHLERNDYSFASHPEGEDGHSHMQEDFYHQNNSQAKAAHAGDSVSVAIGGEVYKLRLGDKQQPEYLEELGHYVNQEVERLQKILPHSPYQTILILALLNFAEELRTAEQGKTHPASTVQASQQSAQDTSEKMVVTKVVKQLRSLKERLLLAKKSS